MTQSVFHAKSTEGQIVEPTPGLSRKGRGLIPGLELINDQRLSTAVEAEAVEASTKTEATAKECFQKRRHDIAEYSTSKTKPSIKAESTIELITSAKPGIKTEAATITTKGKLLRNDSLLIARSTTVATSGSECRKHPAIVNSAKCSNLGNRNDLGNNLRHNDGIEPTETEPSKVMEPIETEPSKVMEPIEPERIGTGAWRRAGRRSGSLRTEICTTNQCQKASGDHPEHGTLL